LYPIESKIEHVVIIFVKGRFRMIIVTTENIANHKITEVIGPVFGLTVRARGIGKDIVASLKGLVGGEISQYTEMLEDARKQAIDRMVKNASAMGASAIIMMRFDSGEIGQNMSEIVAYGTAVIVEKV
jgi:uncharacterized protein YbjQ (UPF0145 family)